ncbi:HNH endonuclease [Thermoactinomyces daqus]|uniref:HNH endonuclease n=1 Tax=Thermoactinomyces daqus TaxID=1329516 RepID=A0A7W2AJN2_9BACL|nr:HNH endonuclease [Thermoactinomyces daqus]MBA4543959.1 HNH endonuclease [Thermoactinomyces daqus]
MRRFDVSKVFQLFIIVFLFAFVGISILGSGQVFASGSSFNVPHVNDHFEKVQQGPAPTKEQSLNQAESTLKWLGRAFLSKLKWLEGIEHKAFNKAKKGDWRAGLFGTVLFILIARASYKSGIAKSAMDFVNMILHPVDTVIGILNGVLNFILHPIQTLKAIWKSIFDSFKRDVINGDQISSNKWAGYVAGTVAGTKGVGSFTKLAKVALVSRVSKVSRAAELGQLGRIGRGINLVQETARKLRIPQTVSKVRGALSTLRKTILSNKIAASVITVASITTGLLALDPEAVVQAFNKITVTAEKFEVKTAFKNAEKCFGYQPVRKYFASFKLPGSELFGCLYAAEGKSGGERPNPVATGGRKPPEQIHPNYGETGVDSNGRYVIDIEGNKRYFNISGKAGKTQTVEIDGEEVEVTYNDIGEGFPDFDDFTVYEEVLHKSRWYQGDATQFDYLNKSLGYVMRTDSKIKNDIENHFIETLEFGTGPGNPATKLKKFFRVSGLRSKLTQEEYDTLIRGQGSTTLVNKLNHDPELKREFLDKLEEYINDGNTPIGYVWHHHEGLGKDKGSKDPGTMQLVENKVHVKNPHLGGRKTWGGDHR